MNDKKDQLINPQTQMNVIKRYLHVLALLQNSKDPAVWNASSLADLLSQDEKDAVLTGKMIRDYIHKYLINELGIEISTTKGGRETGLAGAIDEELMFRAVSLYSFFVVSDSARDMVIKKLMKSHPSISMWMLARIYFAIIENRAVRFDYISNTSTVEHEYLVYPYYMAFRNNNLYLVAGGDGLHARLFIINKIKNLKITDTCFDCDKPSIEDIFRNCLGSFIGRGYEVKLRFKSKILAQLDQIISNLDPVYAESAKKGHHEAEFTVSDDLYLCQQIFLFGEDIEIVSPPLLRKRMVEMLEKSRKVYGKG